jgi:hypothetical protein
LFLPTSSCKNLELIVSINAVDSARTKCYIHNGILQYVTAYCGGNLENCNINLKVWNRNFAYAVQRVKVGGLRYKDVPCM